MILLPLSPDKKEKWFWSSVSRLFHVGTKDIFSKTPPNCTFLDHIREKRKRG